MLQYAVVFNRGIVLGGSGGRSPLAKILEDFGGLAPCKCQVIYKFSWFFYFAQDLQTHFKFCSQYQAHANGVSHHSRQKFWQHTKTYFQFLCANLCHIIVTKVHTLRASHSLKIFRLEIMSLINKYYDILESTVTFRCNNEWMWMKASLASATSFLKYCNVSANGS